MGRLRRRVQADAKSYLTKHVSNIKRAAVEVTEAAKQLNKVMDHGFNDNAGFVDEFLNYNLTADTMDFTRNLYFGMIGNNDYSCSQENLQGVDNAIDAAEELVAQLKAFKKTYVKCGDEYAELDRDGFFDDMYPGEE